MLVHESQIEDILARFPMIAKSTLRSAENLRLIVRQMPLPSGRLDLLFASGPSLLLVELKVEAAVENFVWQIKRYEKDLLELQSRGELIQAPIRPILLAPSFSIAVLNSCAQQGVTAIRYSPDEVLVKFFNELTSLQQFLYLKPKDYGLWNRHLTHRVLYALAGGVSNPSDIAFLANLSRRSVMNHLRFAVDMHLAERKGRLFGLSELGAKYVEARTSDMPPSEVSEAQLATLRNYIAKNPFSSPVFFGIYASVDTVFVLARNTYPVTDELMADYFKKTAGKLYDWKSDTSTYHGLRMYSNYAIELGLLGRLGRSLFLTPDGLRFILLLNLHKSIQMIDALDLGPERRGT